MKVEAQTSWYHIRTRIPSQTRFMWRHISDILRKWCHVNICHVLLQYLFPQKVCFGRGYTVFHVDRQSVGLFEMLIVFTQLLKIWWSDFIEIYIVLDYKQNTGWVQKLLLCSFLAVVAHDVNNCEVSSSAQ